MFGSRFRLHRMGAKWARLKVGKPPLLLAPAEAAVRRFCASLNTSAGVADVCCCCCRIIGWPVVDVVVVASC